MATESIIVQIDNDQLTAQKSNNYSLYLAKKVNGKFTVIWQSKGPVASVNNPSYENTNLFDIAIPNYQVNYTNIPIVKGSVTFTSSGKAMSIALGQSVKLDGNGVFGTPTNTGTTGEITVDNSLQGNPHEILLDDQGNPIFVNIDSGMNVGVATLAPIDEYQVWFDNYQDTGTIIAHNVSNPGLVTFSGGTDTLTISYNKAGQWQSGPLAAPELSLAAAAQSGDLSITVLAYFTSALTIVSATYLANNLISKFANNLRPQSVTVSAGSAKLAVTFSNVGEVAAAAGQLGLLDAAVNTALNAARNDKKSGLAHESWHFDQPVLQACA